MAAARPTFISTSVTGPILVWCSFEQKPGEDQLYAKMNWRSQSQTEESLPLISMRMDKEDLVRLISIARKALDVLNKVGETTP